MMHRPAAEVTQILFEALEREGEARRSYLEQACGQDEDLRGEVESLLTVDDAEGMSRFLAKPALEGAGVLPSAMDEEREVELNPDVPERIGPFRILNRLGFGGMGTVYLAQQDVPIERQVAIKVVHALHHARWRQRFTAECQALARLNHPHIAALYEVGTTPVPSGSGRRPYVAMELIDGEPLTDWCNREHAVLERRLQIFLDVCSGISHAHQNGILHCDLKPANILVTTEGRAKVIDFGIARAVDDLPLRDSTTQEKIFGSPPYITPEVIDESRLDTRTDVYALGLVLYELLVGVLPFRASSIWLLLLQITEQDPETPSARLSGLMEEKRNEIAASRATDGRSLLRSCRGDLDAIVVKAIDRDPNRRYDSPADLAADLRRFLADEPVQARAPSSWELFGRFLKRQKELAITMVALFAALSLGFAARTVEAHRANAEAQRANAEALRANAEALRANMALTESEQILKFLIDLFEAADPVKNQGKTITVRDLLDEGSKRLRMDLVDQPLVRARLLQTVGSIHEALGELESALGLVNEAVEIRGEQLPPGDPLVIESEAKLGTILHQLGRPKEAEAVLSRVLDVRSADPDVDPKLLAMAHRALGMAYWRQGRFPDAEVQLRAGLTLAGETENPRTLAEVTSSLGIVLHGQSRFLESRALFLQALEVLRKEMGPGHPRVATLLNSLGISSRFQPTWKEAEIYFRQAIEIYQGIYEPDHLRTLRSRRNLVTELTRQHRYDEATLEAEDILRLSKGSGDSFLVANARATLGQVKLQTGFVAQAAEIFRHCVAEAQAALPREHEAVLTCRSSQAQALVALGEVETSLAILRDLSSIYESRKNRATRLNQLIIGEAFLTAKRFAGAEEQLRGYLEGLDRGAPVNQAEEAQALAGLGAALVGQGRFDEAMEPLRKALSLRTSLFGSEHPKISESLHDLGMLESRRGHPDQARKLLQRAVAVRRSVYPDGDLDTRASLEALKSAAPTM